MNRIQIAKEQSGLDPQLTPYAGTSAEFVGDVTLKKLVWAGDSKEQEVLAVWFGAGARTRPHVHDVDQVLIVMEGTCAYGDESGVTHVHTGEVITIPGGVWHWHGATPHAPMMHISVRKSGGATNWQVAEKMWAEHYARLADAS